MEPLHASKGDCTRCSICGNLMANAARYPMLSYRMPGFRSAHHNMGPLSSMQNASRVCNDRFFIDYYDTAGFCIGIIDNEP